jgi:hypothetical protein
MVLNTLIDHLLKQQWKGISIPLTCDLKLEKDTPLVYLTGDVFSEHQELNLKIIKGDTCRLLFFIV